MVEVTVYLQEEIVHSAIEDDLKGAVLQSFQGMGHRIFVPVLRGAGQAPQVFFQVPVIGEGAKIPPAAGSSCRAEEILVTDAQVEPPMSSHAQARYGAMLPVGHCGIMTIDIRDQLFGHKGLITDGGIDRAVEPPAAITAIGADEEDTEFIRLLLQLRGSRRPLRVTAAMAMQQIDDGEGDGGRSPIGRRMPGPGGADHHAFDILFHSRAMDQDDICLAGASGKRKYNKEEGQQSFHPVILETNIRERCEYLSSGPVLLNGKFVLVPRDADKRGKKPIC